MCIRDRPAPSATSQPVPYGPRTPTSSPTDVRDRACVTGPTSRTVCCSGPATFAAPLTEIGTSPTPKADSIVNCPGTNSSGAPSVGSSIIVKVSTVSWRRSARRKTRGTIAPTGCPFCRSARPCIAGSFGARPRTGGSRPGGFSLREQRTQERTGGLGGAVQVQQPHPRGRQPAEHHLGHQLHELVPQAWVLLALAAQAQPVKSDGAGAFDGACVEQPLVWRHKPRPAHNVARVGSVDDHCACGGTMHLQGDPAASDDEELVGWLS